MSTREETLKLQLVELQMKVAYQEDALDQLNASLIAQQREVQSLQAKMNAMTEIIQGLRQRADASGSDIYPIHEVPPHY